jgi:hypothetical protein
MFDWLQLCAVQGDHLVEYDKVIKKLFDCEWFVTRLQAQVQ